MAKHKESKDEGRKTDPSSKASTEDLRPKPEPDGKNDSGPEPEIHDREIPPQ